MINYAKVLPPTGEAGYLITVAEEQADGRAAVWETHVLVPSLNVSTSERPPVADEPSTSTTNDGEVHPALENHARGLFWGLLAKVREAKGEPVPANQTLSHEPIDLRTLCALVRNRLVISDLRRIRNESASRDLREAMTQVLSFSL